MADADRLHCYPAVAKPCKDAALAAEPLLPAASADHAPAYPLRLLEAFGAAARRLALPCYHRGYAWFTLLRLWGWLRWESQDMPLASGAQHPGRLGSARADNDEHAR